MGPPPQEPAQSILETDGRIQSPIAGGVGVKQSAGAARRRRQIEIGTISRNANPATRRHSFDPGRHHRTDELPSQPRLVILPTTSTHTGTSPMRAGAETPRGNGSRRFTLSA